MSHDPIERPPKRLRPPYDTRPDDPRRPNGSSEENRLADHADRVAALLEPLEGLTVTDYERRQLVWIAGRAGMEVIAVVAGLLWRAREARTVPGGGRG